MPRVDTYAPSEELCVCVCVYAHARARLSARHVAAYRARERRAPPARRVEILPPFIDIEYINLHPSTDARAPRAIGLFARFCAMRLQSALLPSSRMAPTPTTPTSASQPRSAAVHWFRKGLRLHDNPALLDAIAHKRPVAPLFCLDPHFLRPANVGVNRICFLLDCLHDLDASLRKLHARLFVLRGDPTRELPAFFERHRVSLLTFESDTEPYALERDRRVRALAESRGVRVLTRASHTLYDPECVRERCAGGGVPLTYGGFHELVTRELGEPAEPLDAPQQRIAVLSDGVARDEYAVPTLGELEAYRGHERTAPFRGGESRALAVMDAFLSERRQHARAFEKPQTSPTDYAPASTTQLSPFLKFGALSPRLFYHRLRALQPKTRPPVSLIGQLYWREFFTTVAYVTPNFSRMRGNPICRQIPWDERADGEHFAAWESARTGYPWIDACMTQLRQQGWLHHLARHAVACFLTRGDLWVSWERGRDTFDRLLVDADYSINNANWMWLSCSSFFYQYYRCYSPVSFPKKYDKNGDYVRHFLPVLRDMPAKYIYEPWTAPKEVQRRAGCVVGRDYPAPIVDHATASKQNMSRMKAAYDANKAEMRADGERSKRQRRS